MFGTQKKRASVTEALFERRPLERNLLGLRIERSFFRHLHLLGSVELADGIRLHLPSLEQHGDLALAFAELLLVGAAHERALDVDVVAFAELRRCVLAETVPSDDAMPLRLGMPFFVGTLPGPLSRQRKNRVFAV